MEKKAGVRVPDWPDSMSTDGTKTENALRKDRRDAPELEGATEGVVVKGEEAIGVTAKSLEGVAIESDSVAEGMVAKLKGGATKSDVVDETSVESQGIPEGVATNLDGVMVSKKSQDFTVKLEGVADTSLGKETEAERAPSPISRVMDLVQFGKKNLASTDTRFLSNLQQELQEICSSLTNAPEGQ